MMYSAIMGGVDPPRNDVATFVDPTWFAHPRMNAKLHKILSHLWFRGTTIWLDGNIYPDATENYLVNTYLRDADIALFRHPYRTNAVAEAMEVRGKSESEERIDEFLKEHGSVLKELPLYECGVLIRRDSPRVQRFNELWWSLLCRWSWRDQLTCPLAVAQSGVKVNFIPGNVRDHPHFRFLKRA